MPTDDGGLDEAERALLAELGARHRLWSNEVPRTVARGTENATFAVRDLIVRRSDDVAAVAREVALLHALAAATPVPVPVPLVHEAELGILVYRRLPGESLLSSRRAVDVADALIDVLAALRGIREPQLPVDDYPNTAWHADAVRHFEVVRPHLSEVQAATVGGFLAEPAPPAIRHFVPVHNDLGAEHILTDRHGRVTGIIDWTDAARAEPARDLGTILRDLGPAHAFRVGEALDGSLTDADRARIRFHARCKWLEDLAFALQDPDGRMIYRANAIATFDRTFRDS